MPSRRIRRNSKGAVSSIILLVLVLVAVIAASFAFDYGHGLMTRVQLQTAVDAGALAGIQELAKNPVAASDVTHAQQYALDVAATNFADNVAVSSSSPGMTVTAVANGNAMPRTVTVTATRITPNIFAVLIGWKTMPISATSTASAYQPLTSVKPRQVFPLAVSLDWAPPGGPQAGVPLSSYYGPGATSKTFTIDLNSQQNKNSAWLKDFKGSSSNTTQIIFGQPRQLQNGVVGSLVQQLSVGQVINIPLILGGPPYNDARPIIGAVGFKISQINYPQQIQGTLINPTILHGTPGQPVLAGVNPQSNTFLSQNGAWTVMLTN